MFSKVKKSVLESVLPTPGLSGSPYSTADTAEIDEEIHRQIYSREDELVAVANKLLKREESEDESVARKLAALGFSSSASVKAVVTDLWVKDRHAAVLKRIEYLKSEYPFHKFIDEETVSHICKKYGLLCSRVTSFTGEIPRKNQREIVDFVIRKKDVGGVQMIVTNGMIFHSREGMDAYDARQKEIYESTDWEAKVPGENLHIIAPAAQFRKDPWAKIEGGYKIISKDPIVLQPLKEGGYLIVSSWGSRV